MWRFKIKKGTENLVANHLSRLEIPNLEAMTDKDIDDSFLYEKLFKILTQEIPWFIHTANYLTTGILPQELLHQQWKGSSLTLNIPFGVSIPF